MRYIIRISESNAVNHIANFFPPFTSNSNPIIVADFDGDTPIFFLLLEDIFNLESAKEILFDFVKRNTKDVEIAVRLAKQIMLHNELLLDNFRAVIVPIK